MFADDSKCFKVTDSSIDVNKLLTCDQALFSFRSVKHSGGKGETKNRA